MNASLFQLFSLGEILARLGQTLQTGCIHIFTSRDAANIYFKDGIVVAAGKGLLDGEEVIKQIVEWKDVEMIWLPNETAPASLKSFGANIADYLHAPKLEPEKKKGIRLDQVVKDKDQPEPLPAPAAKPIVFISKPPPLTPSPSVATPVAGKAFDKLTVTLQSPSQPRVQLQPEPQAQSASSIPKPPEIVQPIANHALLLTATKAMPATAQARSNQEEALLQKHKLVLVSGENRNQRFQITRSSSLIGRNPACDINIASSSVSRQHCLLHLTERGLHLKDLGTTNGTKVNGIVLTEGYVNPGDKLTIGHELFILEKDSA
jgi:hypothetical protein